MSTFTFVWKGRDPRGRFRSERVEAENAQLAKSALLREGWSELQFVGDEVTDLARQSLQVPEELEEYGDALGPDDEVRSLEGKAPGFRSQYCKALGEAKGTLILLTLLTAWGFYQHRTWALAIGLAGLGLMLLLFPVIWAWFSLPLSYYNRLNRAKVWHRWDDVLLYVERLEQTVRITRLGVGDVELARCRAQALAATGRLNDGLQLFAKYAEDPNLPHWNYLSFLAGIYDCAKEYQKALECRRTALAEKQDSSALHIDVAYTLARFLNRPAEAREALARAEVLEVTALGIPYLSFLRGLIAYREANFAEARKHLEQAASGFKSYEHNPLVEGLQLLVKSYLCAISAALGELDGARKCFYETEAFLKATGENELLEVCRAAFSPRHTESPRNVLEKSFPDANVVE